ncbi:MAG: DNA translocase FtsK [Spirochaetales bacterium]|nr:DNA translocase FtsK [Spirochaetales bacterium]
MNSNNQMKNIALALYVFAAYLTLALAGAAAGLSSFFLLPGMFLFNCYRLSGFYIPLLLAAFAWTGQREKFPVRLFASLIASLLPFFTMALIEGVFREYGQGASYFITAFGKSASLLLLFLLAAVEVLLIVKGGEYFFSDESRDRSIDWAALKHYVLGWFGFGAEESPVEGESPVLGEASRRDTVQLDSEAPVEWEDVNLEPLAMPSFPSPVEPVPDEPYTKGEDRVQEMIRQVLTGQKEKEEREANSGSFESALAPSASTPQFPVMPPPPVRPLEDERLTPPEYPTETEQLYGETPLEESFLQDPVMEEPLAEDPAFQELAEPHDFVPEPSYVPEEPTSADEAHLNNLIHELDETLTPSLRGMDEEERPESIADKLAPEQDDIPYIEDMPDPPKPPRHKRKAIYKVPVEGILATYPDDGNKEIDDDTRKAARILEETLREFKIEAEVTGISRGPVITMFELLPAPGVKLNRIVALQDNIALRLAASRVRIVAPIPGKHAVGIEIPNKKRSIVGFSDLIMCREMKKKDIAVPIVLGEDISGDSQVIDLARTPHLLIAGSTGSGKSVCVNSLICSILYHRNPDDVKMILVDPKIVELKLYNDIPHLLTPVITEPKRAFQAIQWTLYEMERRYALLDGLGVRDIKTYNKRILEREIATKKLPYLVVVIDEFADLMATSGKELEGIIARLAAMSRAVGIHLVLATQRPSTDVITGLIKANFPSRVAFMVASTTDSRIIIDSGGAEKLLGRGDMLFTSSWDPFPSRVQGAFLSEEEVERIVDYVKTLGEPDYIDDEIFVDEPDDDFELKADDGGDALFDEALDIVIQSGKASASYLQRRLKIGYNRAARLVEEMEMRGIVGPANGSKPREILHVPS